MALIFGVMMETLYSASNKFIVEYLKKDIPYHVYVAYEDMTLPCMYPFGKIYPNRQAAKSAAQGADVPFSFKDTLPVIAFCGLTKNKDVPNMTLDYMRGLSLLQRLRFVGKGGFLSYLLLRQVARVDGPIFNSVSLALLGAYYLFNKSSRLYIKASLKNKYKRFFS